MKTSKRFQIRRPTETQFTHEWNWLAEELIPTYVKNHYSPKEKWKTKPFSKTDAIFFSRGIIELSEFFTIYRSDRKAGYFNLPKFRSSYLLYFLPLQAAKFLTLFEKHSKVLSALLLKKEIQVLDLGAGPATATLAFLLYIAWLRPREIPLLRLHLSDHNHKILIDGRNLIQEFITHCPEFQGKIEITLHSQDWKMNSRQLSGMNWDLVLVGNLLNEIPTDQNVFLNDAVVFFERLAQSQSAPCEILFLEPALKGSAQRLSVLRDALLELGQIQGPCLHQGLCPLAAGRDWCHFSFRTKIPGVWFKFFSKTLSSERDWLKLSYFWITLGGIQTTNEPSDFLVISDPISSRSETKTVLICKPDRPERLDVDAHLTVFRGDVLEF